MKSTAEKRLTDFGLLVLRVGIGIMFIYHGLPKILGGPGLWKGLAGTVLGTGTPGFILAVMGLFSGLAEAGGGVLLIFGFLFRPAALIMLLNMFGAITHHVRGGEGLMAMSHAIEDGIVFLSLLFIGPGKYALDRLICGRRKPAQPETGHNPDGGAASGK